MGFASGYEEVLAEAEAALGTRAAAVAMRLTGRAPLPGAQVARILERVRDRQHRVGYPGDYRAYAARLARP